MKISIKQIALVSAILMSAPQALGAVIVNGNFAESCNLSGWNQDSDGTTGNDFNLGGSNPNCTADISIGDYETSDAFSNTLSQELDLTGASDSTFLLSMNFSVNSLLTSADNDFWADILEISISDENGDHFLANGNFGDLLNIDIDGFADFSLDFELDNLFANQSGLFLGFTLFNEYDDFGSTFSLSKVSLKELPAEVPEPTSLAIFALAFAGLMTPRKHAKKLIRKSKYK
jgi:hypothetical protein